MCIHGIFINNLSHFYNCFDMWGVLYFLAMDKYCIYIYFLTKSYQLN